MAYNTQNFTGYMPYGQLNPQNTQPGIQYPQYNPQTTQPPQIQNGGFVIAPSEEYVKNYPVAPGTTVTFKIETLPYLYTKTVGYSLLDPPVIEKFRLVKEGEATADESSAANLNDLTTAISEIRKDIGALRSEMNRKNYPDKRKGEKNDQSAGKYE